MKRKTKTQLKNLETLKELWELTPPETVDLAQWVQEANCGSVACLGGHAALSGFFPKLLFRGCPYILINNRDEDAWESALFLFGDYDLFEASGGSHADELWSTKTPWQVAYDRINIALAEPYQYVGDQFCK